MVGASSNRPNILLIISDDHGYGDMSFRGSADASTPNLDRLASEGMVFNNGYVTAPVCSPSRAGLIAGAYQQRWGGHWFNDSQFPPEDRPVLPETLRDAGYRTGYFGKVHYGSERPGDRACPDRHGFGSSLYGLAGLSMGRLHYLSHSRATAERYGQAAEVHGVSPLYANGEETDCSSHLTVEFTDRAMEFMDSGLHQHEDPFFCMVAYNAVHNFNWQLPDDELAARALPRYDDFDPETAHYVDWYDGAISPNLEYGREYYLAQLDIMDREIGRLLDYLEGTGQRENTLVVYLTDNGGSTCNYGRNTPLHGTKYSLFEGGVRVPFIVSRPGTVPMGASSDALVSSLDLLPTFAAAAHSELAPVPFDGQDLRAVWEGESSGHTALHFDTGFQWAVRTQDWKLRYVNPDTGHRDQVQTVEHTDIGSGLSLVPMGASVDESATANVADSHPEVVTALMDKRKQWLRDIHRSSDANGHAGDDHFLEDPA